MSEAAAPNRVGSRPFPDDLLARIRDRFWHTDHCPITDRPRIFFENGGGSLKLKTAVARSAEIAAIPDQDQRDNDASRFLTGLIDRGRADLGAYFGAEDGQIISGETGTELLYKFIRAVALGAPPGPVVSSELEHPASLDAARQWAERTGRSWIAVPFDPLSGTVEPAGYGRAVTPDTRLATVIHTGQLTGMRVDLAAICAAIRAAAPDCFIVVDGIQQAPHGLISVAEYGADAYVFSPYKAYSRLAAGFAWVGPRLTALPHEHMLGRSPDRWELGSRDIAMFASQSMVNDYLRWLGRAVGGGGGARPELTAAARAMAGQEAHLLDLLLNGGPGRRGLLARPDVAVIGEPGVARRAGIVSFTWRGLASADLVRHLATRDIRVHARIRDAYSGHILDALGLPDCVRVSLCHYNSADEVLALLAALDEIEGA